MEHYSQPENDPDAHNTMEEIRALIRESIIERGNEAEYEDHPVRCEVIATLQTACMSAHEYGCPIRRSTALLIADVFACALPEESALDSFGRTRSVLAPDRLWEELAVLRQRDLQPGAREYLNWFAGFVLAEQAPELLPDRPRGAAENGIHTITYDDALQLTVALHSASTHPDEPRDQVVGAAMRLALDYGLPAVAYLRIPAVDAASPHLDISFRTAYAGSYDSLHAIFDAQFRVLVDADRDDRLRLQYDDLPAGEQRALRTQLGHDYQVVETAGKFHLFHREK